MKKRGFLNVIKTDQRGLSLIEVICAVAIIIIIFIPFFNTTQNAAKTNKKSQVQMNATYLASGTVETLLSPDKNVSDILNNLSQYNYVDSLKGLKVETTVTPYGTSNELNIPSINGGTSQPSGLFPPEDTNIIIYFQDKGSVQVNDYNSSYRWNPPLNLRLTKYIDVYLRSSDNRLNQRIGTITWVCDIREQSRGGNITFNMDAWSEPNATIWYGDINVSGYGTIDENTLFDICKVKYVTLKNQGNTHVLTEMNILMDGSLDFPTYYDSYYGRITLPAVDPNDAVFNVSVNSGGKKDDSGDDIILNLRIQNNVSQYISLVTDADKRDWVDYNTPSAPSGGSGGTQTTISYSLYKIQVKVYDTNTNTELANLASIKRQINSAG